MALTCKTCGGPLNKGRFYCSNPCRLAGLNSRPRPRSEGMGKTRLTPRGYRRGWVWRDGKLVAMMEHRWVMEQALGRRLTADEVVHHVNGDRADNRLDNLILHRRHSEHLHAEHVPSRIAARDKRRWRAAAMVADGWSQTQVAKALGVSEATISYDLKPLGLRARADHFSPPSTRSR